MATKTIPDLPAGGNLTGSEPIESVQGNVSVRTTTGAIADLAGERIVDLTVAGNLTGSEPVMVVQGGDVVQTTTGAIAALGGGGGGGGYSLTSPDSSVANTHALLVQSGNATNHETGAVDIYTGNVTSTSLSSSHTTGDINIKTGYVSTVTAYTQTGYVNIYTGHNNAHYGYYGFSGGIDITVGDSYAAGGSIHIVAGYGGTYSGGEARFYAGNGGTYGRGGELKLKAGSGHGHGGNVSITGGNSTNQNGGTVLVNPGDGVVRGGDIILNSGNGGSDRAGFVYINAGSSNTDRGGQVRIIAGHTNSYTAATGVVDLIATYSTLGVGYCTTSVGAAYGVGAVGITTNWPSTYLGRSMTNDISLVSGMNTNPGSIILASGHNGYSAHNYTAGVKIMAPLILQYDALPTSDPHHKGQVWRSGGALMISAG